MTKLSLTEIDKIFERLDILKSTCSYLPPINTYLESFTSNFQHDWQQPNFDFVAFQKRLLHLEKLVTTYYNKDGIRTITDAYLDRLIYEVRLPEESRFFFSLEYANPFVRAVRNANVPYHLKKTFHRITYPVHDDFFNL